MNKTSTGRRGLGDILGADGRVRTRPDGRLQQFSVVLTCEQVGRLASLLDDRPQTPPGRILVATAPKLSRIRVVADPLPAYERSAGSEYVRGDVLRVTGSDRSCNVFASRLGAELLAARIRAAIGRASEWVELRARVVRFQPDEGPRSLVEIVPDVELKAERDDERIGATGAALAEQVWPSDDFADWERADA